MTWFSLFLSPVSCFQIQGLKLFFLPNLRFKIISIHTLLHYHIFKSSHFQIAISSLTSIQLLLRHNHSAAANHHIITFSNRLIYIFYILFSCQVEWISMIIEIRIEISFLFTSRYYFIFAIATIKSLEVTVAFKVEKFKV